MEFSFFKGALWQLIKQMDLIATLILLGLFFLSVLCVAIIAYKYVVFRQHRIQLKLLQQKLRTVKSFSEIISLGKEFRDSLGGKFLMQSLAELRIIVDSHAKKGTLEQPDATPNLTAKDLEQLEIVINQSIDSVLLEEEAYLPILGTSAAASPLIGLFGTIWGLIHAFVDISQEKTADIATVAPGMAEALIVTLAGLVVAIPALVAFHYFSNYIRKFEFQLSEIADKFISTAKQAFIK